MHDINDPMNTISRDLAESDELLGKECAGCMRAFPYSIFDKDSSKKDGRKDLCPECANSPVLSTEEHVFRLQEKNFNNEATKKQRWQFQDDYKNDLARIGRPMHSSDFLNRIQKLVPNLYFTPGRIVDCIAVYKIYPGPQERLNGRDFEYLWYIPEGLMPEYSLYEFDEVRDVLRKEKMRGWRTPLIRLIKAGLITQEDADKEFGPATGHASTVWYRTLWANRNKKNAER